MSKEKEYMISIENQCVPVSEELYLYYYRSLRRIKYYEHDIKIEIPVRDKEGIIVAFIPSKEDSLERIMECGSDFAGSDRPEDIVVDKLMKEKLRICLRMLDEDERELLHELFGNKKSERVIATEAATSSIIIHRKKQKILNKIRELMGI